MFGFTPVSDELLARYLGIEYWHVGNRELTTSP
jgi:hypothetical protein